MAKAFSVEYPNGYKEEFALNMWPEAKNVQNFDGTKFFLYCKEVAPSEYYKACYKAEEAWFAKKELTHKKISVQYGVLPTSRVSIWVRK